MLKSEQNYSQGYRSTLTRDQKQFFRQKYCRKSAPKGFLLTFLTLASIYGAIWAAYTSFTLHGVSVVSAFVMGIVLVFVTRQMRALENIVHFGSHNNFFNKPVANDLMTNLLSAWPMLQEVKQYRLFHLSHHGDYGSHCDPCKQRLERIGATGIEINSNRQLIMAILIWMPSYVREFYNEVKSSHVQLIIFLIWHAIVACSAGILISWAFTVLVIGIWIVSMFFILPFLRSIAEFSEHDYNLGDTVYDTTFNNLGLLDHLLLHPAGDAWHALHHLHPTVPWWQQRAAHRYLMKHDDAYREAHHRDQYFQDIASFPVGPSKLKEPLPQKHMAS